MSIESKALVIPPRLKSGDTLGIVAPAGPFDDEKFSRGTQALKDMGFNVFIPEDLFEVNGYLAGTDRHRAKLVNQLFADRAIDAIICARGGYGSIRILPLLDYETIMSNPKIFIGFSDISALLAVLSARCGLVTFHGPVVTTLADATEETRHSLFNAIACNGRPEIKLAAGITIYPGSVSGAVCGGNLTTLCHLVGTPFAPSFKNHILFLEDLGEAPYRIDRMLVQMKLAGCFEGLVGLILGTFEECGSIDEICNIVADVFDDFNVPVLAGLDAGHCKRNVTIPFGIEATLDADRHLLSYHRAATTDRI